MDLTGVEPEDFLTQNKHTTTVLKVLTVTPPSLPSSFSLHTLSKRHMLCIPPLIFICFSTHHRSIVTL